MSETVQPFDPARLPQAIAALVAQRLGRIRVAVDGPPCTRPQALADSIALRLRELGRPAESIRADGFWHDASLRFEHGREDPDSYLTWLDADALRREALDPVVRTGDYLPSLRDPATNRATREPRRRLAADAVLLVSGELLLGRSLPFDLTVHLAASPAARRRHTPAELAWTLAAFQRYDEQTGPAEAADVVVRVDDPRRPAVTGLPPR